MTPDEATAVCQGYMPGLIGMRFVAIAPDHVTAHLDVRPELLAPNGYLHGSTVTALAETACGFGTAAGLADGGLGRFATIDLSCNFVGTALEGTIVCEARRMHAGRTTEMWDARVWRQSDERTIAHFRLTQLLLSEEPPTP